MTSIRPKTRDGSSAGGLGRVTQLLLDAQQPVVLGDALRHEGARRRAPAHPPLCFGAGHREPGRPAIASIMTHTSRYGRQPTAPAPRRCPHGAGGGPLRQVRRSLRPQCGEVRDTCRESHPAHSSGPSAGRPPSRTTQEPKSASQTTQGSDAWPSRTEPRARPDWTRSAQARPDSRRSAQARWSPGTTASDQRGGRRWPRHPRGR